MAVKETKDLITIHVPTKEQGYKFNGRIWTKSSESFTWADGVSYCGIRGAKMQTLDDAVEFRHDSNGADGSSNYQHSGTLSALVKDGKVLRAHIYEPEQDELEKIARLGGVKAGRACFIDVDSTSDLWKRIIDSTNKTGRTFIFPKENLQLSVVPAKGQTAYGANEVVLQLMPRCAEKNSAYIAGNGHNHGFVWFDRPELKSTQMRIRSVGLGGDFCNGIYIVNANNVFYIVGHSRGLVNLEQKSSGKPCVLPSRAK